MHHPLRPFQASPGGSFPPISGVGLSGPYGSFPTRDVLSAHPRNSDTVGSHLRPSSAPLRPAAGRALPLPAAAPPPPLSTGRAMWCTAHPPAAAWSCQERRAEGRASAAPGCPQGNRSAARGHGDRLPPVVTVPPHGTRPPPGPSRHPARLVPAPLGDGGPARAEGQRGVSPA